MTSTNMSFRQFLTNNADTIIQNNQNVATGNCSNIMPLLEGSMPTQPILFTSILSNPSQYDSPSDLKDNFLNKYILNARQSTPSIYY
jgi:hypothetical protein